MEIRYIPVNSFFIGRPAVSLPGIVSAVFAAGNGAAGNGAAGNGDAGAQLCREPAARCGALCLCCRPGGCTGFRRVPEPFFADALLPLKQYRLFVCTPVSGLSKTAVSCTVRVKFLQADEGFPPECKEYSMKKITAVLLLCIVAAGIVCAGGKKDTGVDNSLEDLKARGVFVLGLDDSFPPMGYRDESNNIVGYDIDLAAEVCSRLGVTLKCQPIDWAAKEQELNTGNIDCIWNGFTMTPERKEALAFTDAYLDNAQVVIVRRDSGYKTLSDLAGKTIGLQAGSSASDAVNASPAFKDSLKEIVEFKDNLTALMDLEIKGVDAVVMDMVVGNYSIKQTGKDFVVLDEHLTTEEYGIGFRKGDIKLRDEVQRILNEMAADGTVAAISTKWFGTDISVIGK